MFSTLSSSSCVCMIRRRNEGTSLFSLGAIGISFFILPLCYFFLIVFLQRVFTLFHIFIFIFIFLFSSFSFTPVSLSFYLICLQSTFLSLSASLSPFLLLYSLFWQLFIHSSTMIFYQ